MCPRYDILPIWSDHVCKVGVSKNLLTDHDMYHLTISSCSKLSSWLLMKNIARHNLMDWWHQGYGHRVHLKPSFHFAVSSQSLGATSHQQTSTSYGNHQGDCRTCLLDLHGLEIIELIGGFLEPLSMFLELFFRSVECSLMFIDCDLAGYWFKCSLQIQQYSCLVCTVLWWFMIMLSPRTH